MRGSEIPPGEGEGPASVFCGSVRTLQPCKTASVNCAGSRPEVAARPPKAPPHHPCGMGLPAARAQAQV